MKPSLRHVHTSLTISAAAFGLLGGLTMTLAKHAPSERDLPTILTSPQIEVDAQYLVPGQASGFAQHAVCRCGLWLGEDQIPPSLKQALLAKEDTRFYVHRGLDWIGLGRALLSIVSGGSIQGGSTLTQQLVKNLITGNARSGISGMKRKLREAIIARRVERALTKEQILAAYLNQMDFGSTNGAATIGVINAARKYLGKPVQDLNLHEAAMLVGMLRATTAYNPITNPGAAEQQAQVVLKKMRDQNVIGQNDFSRALHETIQRGSLAQITVSTGYYVAWSRTELARIAGAHLADGRIRFVVGLDLWHQVQGENAIKESIARNEERHVSQGALVSLASDGRVSALVGGADFISSQFDRATRALRQPGSAFKLFVYVAALNKGLRPGSIRPDTPFSVGDWTPENADHEFRGPITLKTAFALSRNTVAARLAQEVGVNAVAKTAHELGVKSTLRHDLSLALGSSEVTLLELTSAYVPFMNEGEVIEPYAARMALNALGEVIYRREPAPQAPVVNRRVYRDMRDMLHAVLTEGTAHRAPLRDVWSAGKTGTSQGNRDAWFVGFTDRLTTGIWFGNDDNSQMTAVAGSNLPTVAWHRFNEAILGSPASGLGTRSAATEPAMNVDVERKPPEPKPQSIMRMTPVPRPKLEPWRDRFDLSARDRARLRPHFK